MYGAVSINLNPMSKSSIIMNISQAAAQTGLSAKQIRDYEKAGLLPATTRTASGYRTYGQSAIERLTFIARARQVGFSLTQIQALLALQDDPNRTSCAVKALTSAHIDELTARIAQLQAMKDTLQEWHDACHGDERSDCVILQSLGASNE